MKTQIFLGLLFLAGISSVISCVQGGETVKDANASMFLSMNKANLSAEKDSVVITAQTRFWWINDILVNGNYLVFNPDETETADFKIKGNWFSIERNDQQQLIVRVEPNESTSDRSIRIKLGIGEDEDYVDVFQACTLCEEGEEHED